MILVRISSFLRTHERRGARRFSLEIFVIISIVNLSFDKDKRCKINRVRILFKNCFRGDD